MRANSAGTHLIVDGYAEHSLERQHLELLIYRLATQLEMRLLAPPQFFDVDLDPSKLHGDEFQDEGGTTGFAIVSTSHISVHTWPLRRFFSLDVFSCKDFEPEGALELIRRHLGVISFKTQVILRTTPEAHAENTDHHAATRELPGGAGDHRGQAADP